MATVTFFLVAYDDTPDYDFLNRLICQWRKVEEETRRQCNLPSVYEEYPGCYYYQRFGNSTSTYNLDGVGVLRNVRADHSDLRKPAISAHDIILHNDMNQQNHYNFSPKIILLDETNTEPDTVVDFDWDAFIQSQYEQEEARQGHRHLMDYAHVGPWFNYFPMVGVKTEYYFRYSGTQTIPPCYGRFQPRSNRGNTNNWRVMKDPIRVSKRQIDELHRLLRERIAPPGDPLRPCQRDTAAKKTGHGKKISVARPLQSTRVAHFMVFCECENWGSKWEEDKSWCRQKNKTKRLYQHPYNFPTDGF